MYTVAIIDDHPIARRGLMELLMEEEGVQVTASSSTYSALANSIDVRSKFADVVLFDLYHNGDDPCHNEIRLLSSVVPVLVVSAFSRRSDVVDAIRAGANGYITKDAPDDQIRAAARTVASGYFWLSSKLAHLIRDELSRETPTGSARASQEVLTDREWQVLELVSRGFTHYQVATRMGLTKATVDTYVSRIRAKLHVGNKAELTQAAMRLGQRKHE